MKRVMVDMSVSLLHHGHIRLLQKAKELGHVIVALTTDDEILLHKGYHPELTYEERKEMLLALRYVDEVVPCTWQINDEFLKQHNADVLVHSGPNFNDVQTVVNFDRTQGVSSTDMRDSATRSIVEMRNSQRCLLTPGPTNLHPENLLDLQPVFTRGDEVYTQIERKVFANVLKLTGQDSIAALQGSATTAIEVATSNFISGNVAVVTSGYYSQRLLHMLERKQRSLPVETLKSVDYDSFINDGKTFGHIDWVVCAYTETADAFLADLPKIKNICDSLGAKLMVDATGSINLEDHHELADVLMFSSCKGLGGLAGAGFITFNQKLLASARNAPEFILDIATYLEKKTTAPVHAVSSLHTLSERFADLRARVGESKQKFVELYGEHLARKENQPTLCTKVKGLAMQSPPPWLLTYKPRTAVENTQVICHLFDQFPSNRDIGQVYEHLLNPSMV